MNGQECLIELADKNSLNLEIGYTDEECIHLLLLYKTESHTTGTRTRIRGDYFDGSGTAQQHHDLQVVPLGVHHPHAKLHHIKKENIGLIEVMAEPRYCLPEKNTINATMYPIIESFQNENK